MVSPYLSALLQDLAFASIFIGMGMYLARKRSRSASWGLIGPTIIGLFVILPLPKKANSEPDSTQAASAG